MIDDTCLSMKRRALGALAAAGLLALGSLHPDTANAQAAPKRLRAAP